MGATLSDTADRQRSAIDAFGYLNRRMKSGIVLTGTGKAAHLVENIRNFRLAKTNSPDSSET